jgi:hypothetical protein
MNIWKSYFKVLVVWYYRRLVFNLRAFYFHNSCKISMENTNIFFYFYILISHFKAAVSVTGDLLISVFYSHYKAILLPKER